MYTVLTFNNTTLGTDVEYYEKGTSQDFCNERR